MKCWEFVEKFSEFEDAQDDAPIRKAGEEHLLQCEKCRRYSAVVSEGLLILKDMPPEKLPEKRLIVKMVVEYALMKMLQCF